MSHPFGQDEIRGLLRRPLPSFDEWLTENGDGTRGDGFEALHDLAYRTHANKPIGTLSPDEASFLRFWMGMQVAIVELSNIEHQRGRRPEEIILTMARVLGTAAMYSVASVLSDDTSLRPIAKVLVEEFRFAAKEAADQIEGSVSS